MKRVFLITFVCLLLLTACSSSSSSPEQLARSVMQAASDGNINRLEELFTEDTNPGFFNYFVSNCKGTSTADLNYKVDYMISSENDAIITVYQGTKRLLGFGAVKIGKEWYGIDRGGSAYFCH